MSILESKKRITASDRVAGEIERRILGGVFAQGTFLPGRRLLAAEFGVAPLTIDQAVKKLAARGLVRSEHGRGTFVKGAHNGAADLLSNSAMPVTPLSSATLVGVVSMLLPHLHKQGYPNPWEAAAFQAFEREMSAKGRRLKYIDLNYGSGGANTVAGAVKALVEAGVHGVVVLHDCSTREVNEACAGMDVTKTPIVFAGSRHINALVPSVSIDNIDAGYQAANHIIRQGCKHLLFFAVFDDVWVQGRLTGVRTAIDDCEMPRDIAKVAIDSSSYEEMEPRISTQEMAYRFAKTVLNESGKFDGVIAANDENAYGFMQAAAEFGLTAGEDYAIMGFDDLRMSREIGLTSLSAPWLEMGTEAATLIQRVLLGDRTSLSVSLHTKLVERASSQINHSTKP